jgi:hypothetical protein
MYACAGVLQFPALVQRHQSLFSLGALCVSGMSRTAQSAARSAQMRAHVRASPLARAAPFTSLQKRNTKALLVIFA